MPSPHPQNVPPQNPQPETARPKHLQPKNPWHGLLHAVAERLIPLFQLPGQTTEYARSAALEAIAAYRAESRADYASIGRILALSLATIAAVGQSTGPELAPRHQLAFLTKANALSRSAEQAERSMHQRRRRHASEPDIEDYLIAPPEPEAPAPEASVPAMPTPAASAPKACAPKAPAPAAPDLTDEAVLAQIDAVMAGFHAMLPTASATGRPPFAATPAAPLPVSLRNQLATGMLRAAG